MTAGGGFPASAMSVVSTGGRNDAFEKLAFQAAAVVAKRNCGKLSASSFAGDALSKAG